MEYKKGVDVLCIFYEGTPPTPKKFKIRYKNGSVKTVEIDQIRMVNEMFKSGISNHHFVYYCISEVNENFVSYILKYFVNDMKWELILHNI